ncbi:MAG: hypothetical protein E6J91_37500 [Deltaproteobacteria bacterium]|nr:MAG: hypothetical protein E6J91_37500 [Deltaproteobacteria bacterium]
MPPRYKLRLDRLDFISCVDKPAQQTAKVVLIKRAGLADEEQVTALASVMKIGEGDDPYVYCWAFTCTDATGAPYHDLQGDAISPDFLQAAEEFIRRGAASDEMHDAQATGYVAFAFPMDVDIAKGFFGAVGEAIKTSGLMIALRPSKEALAKFRSGEYTGVSIAGTGTREIAKTDPTVNPKKPRRKPDAMAPGSAPAAYKRVSKLAALTSETAGHRHSIDLSDPADEWWSERLSTSDQAAEGADQSHRHAWTYDPVTGAVTIGEDSGHSHTVDAVVPPDVLAAAAEDVERRCPICGAKCDDGDHYCPMCGKPLGGDAVPTSVVDEPSSGKTSVVVVAARAPASISTPAPPAPTVDGKSQENPPMDPKFAKMLAAALALPEPQRLHVAKLGPEDQAAFLGMSPADQDNAVKAAEAADPEVYKTAAGISIRKSHGPLAEQMARQADTTAAELAKQAQQLAIEKAERARVTLEKRASDLIPLIGASLAERVAIIKAVDGIADEGTRNGALEALKGANEAFRLLGVPRGAGGDSVPENKSPRKAWEDGLADFAKSKNIANPLDAIVPFLKTAQGQTLSKALDAQRPLAQPS